MTSETDRFVLLSLARDAISSHVSRLPAPTPPSIDVLLRRAGAFVSLHVGRDLRGCIGHIEANEPLAAVIPRCAVAACSEDPRFKPVAAIELPGITIELSLLGALEAISSAGDIEIGRHGLVVEAGWHRGLLLPQVATEWNWDCETFLSRTCQKAGLPRDAWKTGARLWRFDAEVFSEAESVR